MPQLRKPYLLLSSFLLLTIFVSCRISKFKHPTECNRVVITADALCPVINETKATKFKASIDVLKNHLNQETSLLNNNCKTYLSPYKIDFILFSINLSKWKTLS